jgi:hypothetical protein
VLNRQKSHHPDPAAIRADPGRAIADGPHVFLETIIADLEATGTVPAKGQFPPAAMALELTEATATACFFGLFFGHIRKAP